MVDFSFRDGLFGADVTVVRLCSLASVLRFLKLGVHPASPEPYPGAVGWKSHHVSAEDLATRVAKES